MEKEFQILVVWNLLIDNNQILYMFDITTDVLNEWDE